MRVSTWFLGLCLCLLASCGDELSSNKFCSLPARFTFSPVNSISQLYSSCESMGEWCSIELTGNQFLFTKANGSQGKANRTALEGYTGFYMGLSGFIVGLPNIPELGETASIVTCYDLACRNCYDTAIVARPLTLRVGGYAYCSRCHRTYDLNNIGMVSDVESGNPLYRYRVYYGNNTLNINNR